MSNNPLEKEIPNRELIRRFLDLIWPYRWYVLPAFIAMLGLASTSALLAYLVQPVLDRIFVQQDKTILYATPAIVMGIFLVRGVIEYFGKYMMDMVGEKIVRTAQVRSYAKFMELDMQFFMSMPTGNFISRVIVDTNMLKGAVTSAVTSLVEEGFTLIGLVGVLFYRDAELALVAVVGLPGASLLVYKFGRRMRRLGNTQQKLMENVVSHLQETISGLRIVKAFGMESLERAAFRQRTKNVLQNKLRISRVNNMSGPMMDLITGTAISSVILYGGSHVIAGTTTTGAFFSFLTALLLAYAPVKKITSLNNNIQQGLAAARRIFNLWDITPTIRDKPDAVPLPPLQQEILFDNISFSYGPDLPQVIKGVTLRVAKGERVALVGKSGSGKTTLVNLTPRFFDVTTGAVRIDGHDIRDVTLRSLRAQMALVTQEVILFNDTVRNNIAYGHNDRTQEEIREAARTANALEFIEALPEGFDTVIGDRGVKLSGGQRQRLSIARSLLRGAPILILDEATSSLDSESELAVQEALDRLMEDRTTLVIAHRLSTIRNAHRIVVLQEGTIVEQGTHHELLEQGGEYARLHALQFRDHTPSPDPA